MAALRAGRCGICLRVGTTKDVPCIASLCSRPLGALCGGPYCFLAIKEESYRTYVVTSWQFQEYCPLSADV